MSGPDTQQTAEQLDISVERKQMPVFSMKQNRKGMPLSVVSPWVSMLCVSS